MAGYYDSSLLLSAVFNQFEQSGYIDAWDGEAIRVASLTAKIECAIAVRRLAAGLGKREGDAWIAERLAALDEYFLSLTTKPVDNEIEQIIRQNSRLASCRALDAIHLATALYFQPNLQEPLRVCSLDRRLREVALVLGFEVRPVVMPVPFKPA